VSIASSLMLMNANRKRLGRVAIDLQRRHLCIAND